MGTKDLVDAEDILGEIKSCVFFLQQSLRPVGLGSVTLTAEAVDGLLFIFNDVLDRIGEVSEIVKAVGGINAQNNQAAR